MGKRPTDMIAINHSDVELSFSHGGGRRLLSFNKFGTEKGEYKRWRDEAKQKLQALLGLETGAKHQGVTILREEKVGQVTLSVLQMKVSPGLSIPAYYLLPDSPSHTTPVMAIHGHGEAEACIGLWDDYHHSFALALAQAGYAVLCPELRGFGSLKDMARDIPGGRLDYWNWGGHMAYSLVSDAVLHGQPLIGQTVSDLLLWEEWLCGERKSDAVYVAGISYGGDLALLYPVFSLRTKKIFASGTLGSFSVIFSRCYNAPAHVIPDVLNWFDRSDIAGLNAPTPLAIHYGALDVPGPENHSASYNETVDQSFEELRTIYAAADAPQLPTLIISQGKKHEMDVQALIDFLGRGDLG